MAASRWFYFQFQVLLCAVRFVNPANSIQIEVFAPVFFPGSMDCTGPSTFVPPAGTFLTVTGLGNTILDFCYNDLNKAPPASIARSRRTIFVPENQTLESFAYELNDCNGAVVGEVKQPYSPVCSFDPATGTSSTTMVAIADSNDFAGVGTVDTSSLTDPTICTEDIRSAVPLPGFQGFTYAYSLHIAVGACYHIPISDNRIALRAESRSVFTEFENLNCTGESNTLAPGCYCCTTSIPDDTIRYLGDLPTLGFPNETSTRSPTGSGSTNSPSLSPTVTTDTPTSAPTPSPEPATTSPTRSPTVASSSSSYSRSFAVATTLLLCSFYLPFE